MSRVWSGLWNMFWARAFVFAVVWGFMKLKAHADRQREKMTPKTREYMENLHGHVMTQAKRAMQRPTQSAVFFERHQTTSGRPEWRDPNGNFISFAD